MRGVGGSRFGWRFYFGLGFFVIVLIIGEG